ncbi:NnrU family protein [Roseibium sp. RKSG952]|uniref:NnrU family protein n=1 Tax=Roseibium sp. RKSG952 TaxID=2529384 RepID=UPI0012BD7373|nr:NnrU family protein [Roseibium sp. RKSG952]MTH97983.1 NnrU family protein [Roseibium sp. RKSG952]
MNALAWGHFGAAFVMFFASHMVLIRPPLRPRLEAVIGQRGFTAAYSALSLAILWWLVLAANAAPFVELWPRALWQNWIPIIAMVPACLCLSFAVGRPNPFSFGGRKNDRFDPARAGILRYTRHPLLMALALWSTSHIVPNGDLAHVLLFGTFTVFSILGMRMIDRRRKVQFGPMWDALSKATRESWLPAINTEGLLRGMAGLATYALLALLHPYLLGVSPFIR